MASLCDVEVEDEGQIVKKVRIQDLTPDGVNLAATGA